MKLNSYSAIELGSIFTKIVVAEFNKGNIYIVASCKVITKGYENGTITDLDEFTSCLSELLNLVETKYRIKIDEAILILPNISHKVHMAGANMVIQTPMHLIGMPEIQKIRQDCRNVKLQEGEIAIDECPIKYTLDSGKTIYSIPLNLQSNTLQLTSYIHSLPKEIVEPLLKVFQEQHIDILDAYLLPFCCFSYVMSKQEVPLICIHYDEDSISIAYFESQHLLKSNRINFGEKNLINTLSEHFQISKQQAIHLLDSYFITDLEQAQTIEIDQSKKISEYTISKTIQEQFDIVKDTIRQVIQQYCTDFNLTDVEIKISGKWLNYPSFVSYFNHLCGFHAKGIYNHVLGLTSNEYMSLYGAIMRFIMLNKDYILHREEDENQKPSFNNQSKEQAKTLDKQNKKFIDIFDEEE